MSARLLVIVPCTLREHLAASWAAPVAWRDRVRAALADTITIPARGAP